MKNVKDSLTGTLDLAIPTSMSFIRYPFSWLSVRDVGEPFQVQIRCTRPRLWVLSVATLTNSLSYGIFPVPRDLSERYQLSIRFKE